MRPAETGIAGIWLRHYPNGRERYGWTAIYGGRTYRQALSRVALPAADPAAERTVSARAGRPDLRALAK
jgi:hypothetical protein